MSNYKQQWRYFKWARFTLLAVLILGVSPLLPMSLSKWDLFIDVFEVIPIFVLAIWLYRWKCPRCGKPFAGRSGGLFLPAQCASCGLPKYSTQ